MRSNYWITVETTNEQQDYYEAAEGLQRLSQALFGNTEAVLQLTRQAAISETNADFEVTQLDDLRVRLQGVLEIEAPKKVPLDKTALTNMARIKHTGGTIKVTKRVLDDKLPAA